MVAATRALAVARLMEAMGCDVRRSPFVKSGLLCRTHSSPVDRKTGCQVAMSEAERVTRSILEKGNRRA